MNIFFKLNLKILQHDIAFRSKLNFFVLINMLLITNKMTFSLSTDIINCISQFNTDMDNAIFIQCCTNIKYGIQKYPRQTEFIIDIKSKDMYKKYKNIHFKLHKYATIEYTQRVFQKLKNIEMCYVTQMKLNYNVYDNYNFIEIDYGNVKNKFLEKLSNFENVLFLDVLDWEDFRSFHKFPNITKLSIRPENNYEYPDMPKLTHLVTPPFISDDILPKNWINIEVLISDCPIPETYTNLSYLITNDLDIPNNIAKLIKYLVLVNINYTLSKYSDYIANYQYVELNLFRFSNLQELYITDISNRKIHITNGCSNIKTNNLTLYHAAPYGNNLWKVFLDQNFI